MFYSELEIWLKDGGREYSLMVTFQGGEKSAMPSSRNVWVYRCCFTQQSLVFINDPEKGVHSEWYLDGVKLFWVIKWCAGRKNSRRPHKTERVKRWQTGFDQCKVKHRITCQSWKFQFTKSWSNCCQLSEIFGSNCSSNQKNPLSNRWDVRHDQEEYWEQDRKQFAALWEIAYSYPEYSLQF